ncbi:hypothetical protein J4207_03545 [Candidatus Woesearchaeota archaeon]|nr:hypothetical protein [Candidatus Woesearchaeota archaeon]
MQPKEVTGYESAKDFIEGRGDHRALIDGKPVERRLCYNKRYVEGCGKLYEILEQDGKVHAFEIEDEKRRRKIEERIIEYGCKTLSEAMRETERAEVKKAVDKVVNYMVNEGGMEKFIEKFMRENPHLFKAEQDPQEHF